MTSTTRFIKFLSAIRNFICRLECAVCGIQGKIVMDGDRTTIVFPEEEQKRSILELEVKKIHFYEIREVNQNNIPNLNIR